MATNLSKVIKKAALQAVEAQNPADLRFGTVTNIEPLEVTVTNQFVLPAKLLDVPEHLTDYTIQMGIGSMNGSEDRQLITIYAGLRLNDRVALLRAKGGQKYLILGRLFGRGRIIDPME